MFDAYPPLKNLKKCRILVSNDDGIGAPGLEVLERIARTLSDDVWVVAPEHEQSGAGHSLTLHSPLRIREVSAKRFAVSGTPTDAVLLGVKTILPKNKKIDLVLSGVNRGANLAEDVTYSGTIAAAMEGTLLNIRSIALSQAIVNGEAVKWQVAEKFAPGIIQKLVTVDWPAGRLMNVNFPNLAASKVKGVRIAPQGRRKIGEKIEKRLDPRGRPYYWIGGEWGEKRGEMPGTDVALLVEGYITATALCMDLTDYKALEVIREQFNN